MENRETPQEAAAGARKSVSGEVVLMPLVLASASPRRAEILRAVGWPCEIQPAQVDESMQAGETAATYVRRLARAKAEAVAAIRPESLVLGADTVVVINGRVLGKPRDAAEARRMISELNKRTHQVLTGVALVCRARVQRVVAHQQSEVTFGSMSEAEIDWYVQSGEPLDKAGAYGVQGRAALFIERLEGDYWNVVGLPINLVYTLARKL